MGYTMTTLKWIGFSIKWTFVKGRDLHALTGWIPELIQIHDDDPNFNSNNLFDQLKSALNDGKCLITFITDTEISEEEVKRSGLVARHAYAVLDMREIDVS